MTESFVRNIIPPLETAGGIVYKADPRLPKKMRHLEGAMKLVGPRGMCFHRSVAFVLDIPMAELCIGTFRAATEEERARPGGDRLSPTPFIHAWAEWKGLVWAPTTVELRGGLFPINRDEYLHLHAARDVKRLTRGQVKQLSRRYGFEAHLKRFAPLKDGAVFGDVLMAAAGVKWRDNGLGGVEAVE